MAAVVPAAQVPPPPPIGINLSQVPNAAGAPLNVLRTGEIHLVVTQINNLAAARQKLEEIAHCLSQALSAQKEQYTGICISTLRDRFLLIARNPTHKQAAQQVLEMPQHHENESLKDLIEKVKYYNTHGILKFFHHLHEGMYKQGTVSGNVFKDGFMLFITGGIAQYFGANANNSNAERAGTAGLIGGAVLMASPFLHAIKGTWKGEP